MHILTAQQCNSLVNVLQLPSTAMIYLTHSVQLMNNIHVLQEVHSADSRLTNHAAIAANIATCLTSHVMLCYIPGQLKDCSEVIYYEMSTTELCQ